MTMEARIETILAELREGLEKIYGDRLVQLILYGSRARGDAEPDSDIDVMVVLKGPVIPGREIDRTSELRASLSLKYEVLVSCVYMPEERYSAEQSSLLINVRREGIRI
jgi:predicted nucleotidyltransferase